GAVGTVSGLLNVGRYVFGAVNPSINRAYFVNLASNVTATTNGLPGFVAVIDTTTDSVVANVPVGNLPFGLGINTQTGKVYVGGGSVVNSFATTRAVISVIDSANNVTVANTTAFEANVNFQREFVVNPTSNKVYFLVTNSPTGVTAGVLDGATNVATPLSTSFGNVVIIRVNPVLNRVYLGNSNGDVFVLDGATGAQLALLDGAGEPSTAIGTQSYIAVDTSNNRFFVGSFSDSAVTVFDGNDNSVLAYLPAGNGPTAIAVDSGSPRVYLGNALDNTVTVLDGANLSFVGTVTTPFAALVMALDPAEARIYTSSGALPASGAVVIADNFTNANTLKVDTVTYTGSGEF